MQALYEWQLAEKPAEALIQHISGFGNFKQSDEAYFINGIKSILADIPRWDEMLKSLIDRELTALDPIEHAILWIGLYELTEQPAVPPVVVINEAVEVSKLYGATESHKYINGVLDKVVKQMAQQHLS